jgi:hypothetical protein
MNFAAAREKERTARMTSRFAAIALAALFVLAGGCGNRGGSGAAAINSSAPSSSIGSDSAAVPQSGGSAQVSSADASAIRSAIEDHLRGNRGLNMDAMEMVVDSVAINGDQAQAHASFHVKNGGATGMTMQYFLQRSGNGWVVTNGQPADGNTQLPPSTGAHPGVNSTQASPSMPDVNAFFKEHPAPKSN